MQEVLEVSEDSILATRIVLDQWYNVSERRHPVN